jgi:surface antigen
MVRAQLSTTSSCEYHLSTTKSKRKSPQKTKQSKTAIKKLKIGVVRSKAKIEKKATRQDDSANSRNLHPAPLDHHPRMPRPSTSVNKSNIEVKHKQLTTGNARAPRRNMQSRRVRFSEPDSAQQALWRWRDSQDQIPRRRHRRYPTRPSWRSTKR